MNEPALTLAHAPIIEAVVDIDCDMTPGQDFAALEAAGRGCFGDRYPRSRTRFLQEHQIEQHGDSPPRFSARRGIQAFLFLHDDEKQLVQVRQQGF